jgi:CRP-like cAMP-binding protein
MALEQDIDRLASQPLFALLPREALRLIAFAAEARILRAGDVLFRKGEAADAAYLVISGTLALDARDDGSPSAYLAEPDTLIGETAMLAEVQRPATAIAREMTTVMRISRVLMARVLQEFPDSAVTLHQAISDRVAAMAEELDRVRWRLAAIDR